ncbi:MULTISPECIES: hypothetical protein [unclassified Mesorhizobium]|uniref:hypothetical protein n=1 Tax=unclassified Mesorhizobium TaxID=325217 RepID=UPI001CCB0F19|nr:MULTISPECIES: hypothetical protein [unclassified Mesorhizobium]
MIWATVPSGIFTLVLTTNRRVPVDLFSDVQAAGVVAGIHIDIWDQSRLADHLDRHPEGQWLRRELGFAPNHLSASALRSASHKSLASSDLRDGQQNYVGRQVDAELADAVAGRSGVLFFIAESGQGKSSSVQALMRRHMEGDGFALVIRHEDLERSQTLEDALEIVLKRHIPSLATGCGAEALQLASPERTLLTTVEDVNQASNPAALVERLAGWCLTSRNSSMDERHDHPQQTTAWNLICPLWPKVVDQLSERSRKIVLQRSLFGGPFKPSEGAAAVLSRTKQLNQVLTLAQCSETARALGHDPLLIALYDAKVTTSVETVMRDFVIGCIRRASSFDGQFASSDYFDALFGLATNMLAKRIFEPRWREVRDWFTNDDRVVQALSSLSHRRELIWLIPRGDDDLVTFRHDRVRDYLLADSIARMMQYSSLPEEILSEPYFSELIASALVSDRGVERSWVEKVEDKSPLALFYALKLVGQRQVAAGGEIVVAIERCLVRVGAKANRYRHLKAAAVAALAGTDSSIVLSLVDKIERSSLNATMAKFRNGDFAAGARLCYQVDPGVNSSWRDRLIDHVKIKFGQALIDDISRQLRTCAPGAERIGVLNLSGFVGSSDLAGPISEAWGSYSAEELSAFLWAASQCACAGKAEVLLRPICAVWAQLPDDEQIRHMERRSGIAAHSVRWGIARNGLPEAALSFFLWRAQSTDLSWPITFMLHGYDHPDVVEFLVRTAGHNSGFNFSHFCEQWDVRWPGRHGKALRKLSLERLHQIWSDGENDDELRRRAFRMWSGSVEVDLLPLLRTIDTNSPFFADALRVRLLMRDMESYDAFKHALEGEEYRSYWWQFTRNFWLPSFLKLLEAELERRRDFMTANPDKRDFETDWIVSELIQKLPTDQAEGLLSKHWVHLGHTDNFVCVALFVATDRSRALAESTVTSTEDPSSFLRHVDFQFESGGFERSEKCLKALESLIPYLNSLDEDTIGRLWDLCNRHRLFEWRRRYLDELVASDDRRIEGLNQKKLFTQFDKEVDHRSFYAGLLVEQFEARGDRPSDLLDVALAWLKDRNTIDAFDLVGHIFVAAGTRSDFNRFHRVEIESSSQIEDMLADFQFALKRRTLV